MTDCGADLHAPCHLFSLQLFCVGRGHGFQEAGAVSTWRGPLEGSWLSPLWAASPSLSCALCLEVSCSRSLFAFLKLTCGSVVGTHSPVEVCDGILQRKQRSSLAGLSPCWGQGSRPGCRGGCWVVGSWVLRPHDHPKAHPKIGSSTLDNAASCPSARIPRCFLGLEAGDSDAPCKPV